MVATNDGACFSQLTTMCESRTIAESFIYYVTFTRRNVERVKVMNREMTSKAIASAAMERHGALSRYSDRSTIRWGDVLSRERARARARERERERERERKRGGGGREGGRRDKPRHWRTSTSRFCLFNPANSRDIDAE